ncbi:MAG: carbohydrate ABC transporter permease [Firmicutes bacterium]|nr:carbohydrate ABC transporter permease [Bacillota bacterium]
MKITRQQTETGQSGESRAPSLVFPANSGEPARRSRRPRLAVNLPLLLLSLMAVVSLFPLYWLFVSALTPSQYSLKMPPDLFPVHASFENFQRLFQYTPVFKWMSNSLLIALSVTAFHVLFDTMAGYGFAKKRFAGSKALFWIILATLMVPFQVKLVPVFKMVTTLGLADSFWGVVLPSFADVFGIFLMKQYLQTIPSELIEAAYVDGASELRIFWQLIIPLAAPAIAALSIFSFVGSWNSFLWPLIVLRSGDKYTLPVGIATIQGEFSQDWGVIMAGGAIAVIPMTIFFLLFQRYFLEGVRTGALKG